jgi:hypothetical protein
VEFDFYERGWVAWDEEGMFNAKRSIKLIGCEEFARTQIKSV